MKILSTFILTLLSCLTFGQFAIIQDKEGYCHVRDSADVASRVIDKLNNGHFVYSFEKKGNWINVDYTKNQVDLRGYVYHDCLKSIADYENIPVLTKAANSATFRKDSVSVIVTQQGFDRSKNKLSYYKEAKGQIELINGKPIWGTDGELPHSEYKSIIVSIGKRKVGLPKTALANLFEPRLSDTEVNYDKENDILYIRSSNSDGAGFYQVIWKIEKGHYKDRYIASGF